jgi:hypothetical protein
MSEQIYMGVSKDGRHWEALNGGNPVLVSDVGEMGVRDSFLLRSHDGHVKSGTPHCGIVHTFPCFLHGLPAFAVLK